MIISKKIILFLFLPVISIPITAQTVIPNAGFENWTTTGNFTNPTGWDTPNEELMAIPFFGFPVVTKSSDHQGTGSFSAKLETKHLTLPPLDVPGFMTCGNLTVNFTSASYVLSGGVPVFDQPTHLKGFYKFIPKGGDSCLIGIGLWRNTGGVPDTLGTGFFSTKDTVTDWTPFSAWIDYEDMSIMPDSMNIIAMSTAQEIMTPGTVLYVDNLSLDYTVGRQEATRTTDIKIYQDKETKRFLIFPGQANPSAVSVMLWRMDGHPVPIRPDLTSADRIIFSYDQFIPGIYLLSVIMDQHQVTRKFSVNP